MTSRRFARARSTASFSRIFALIAVSLELLWPAMAAAQQPPVVVRDYELVSERRIDRTRFEYTYAAYASNWDDHDVTASATLAFVPANVTIVEGALDFGVVVQGDTVRSVDTFTIRHTRDVRLDERSLFFGVQATAAPLTTYQKIDAAALAGTIDDETALVYKVFADFDDPRLPAALLGGDDPGFDGPAIHIAGGQLASLSQATRDLLAPFLLRPDEAGSWVELQAGGSASALASASAGGAMASSAPSISWDRVPVTIGGDIKAWIWWMDERRPGDRSVAEGIAGELEDYLWAKLTSAFLEPVADDDLDPGPPVQPNPQPHGPDGALDIYLTTVKRSVARPAWDQCDGSPEGTYILLAPSPNFPLVAHELMHAITASYPLETCISEYHWMNEATASWAEHFAYDGDRPVGVYDTEHWVAPAFLRKPRENPYDPAQFPRCRTQSVVSPAIPDTGEALHLDESLCGAHQYGSYLWFLNLTQGKRAAPADAGPVRFAWINAGSHLSIFAINSTAGGFDANWQTFLANNWNGDPADEQPHRDYVVWDELEKRAYEQFGGEIEVSTPPYFIAIDPILHQLPPLAAQYNHFDFTGDPKIRQVWYYNDYVGSDPRANVGAIVKVQGEWKRIKNWSNDQKRVFCRDKPEEDIQELVLIISNMDLNGAQNPTTPVEKLGGPDTQSDSPIRMVYSPVPCHDWTGTVAFQTGYTTETGESVMTTSNATNLRFHFDAATSDPYSFSGLTYFDLVEGAVAWHEEAVVNECTDPQIANTFTPTGQMMIAPAGVSLIYRLINTSVGSYDEDVMICSGGPTLYGRDFSEWVPTQGTGFHSTTNVDRLEGGEEYGNYAGDGWSWTFVKP